MTKNKETCPTCGGSGWNQDLKSFEMKAPITGDKRSLEALKKYTHDRLCCKTCNGHGLIDET
jgi:DnaJ-class molecular chaperone